MHYKVYRSRQDALNDLDHSKAIEDIGAMPPEDAYRIFMERHAENDNVLIEYDMIYGELVEPVVCPRRHIELTLNKEKE